MISKAEGCEKTHGVIPLDHGNAELVYNRFGYYAERTFGQLLSQKGRLSINKKDVRVVGVHGFGAMGCAAATADGNVLKITEDTSEVMVWERVREAQLRWPSEFRGFVKVHEVETTGKFSLILKEEADLLVNPVGLGFREFSERTMKWLGLVGSKPVRFGEWETMKSALCADSVSDSVMKKISALDEVLSDIEDINMKIAEHPIDALDNVMPIFVMKYKKVVSRLPCGMATQLRKTLLACPDKLDMLPVDLHSCNVGWRKGRNEVVVFDVQGIECQTDFH